MNYLKKTISVLSVSLLGTATVFGQFENNGTETDQTKGKVEINVQSQTNTLEENLLKVTTTDAPSDYLSIWNGTMRNGEFIPVLVGLKSTDNRQALTLSGRTPDANDAGTEPLMVFDARRASHTPIQTRPLFQWKNYSSKLMTMTANGNLGIGTIAPAYKLDVNGNTRIVGDDNNGSSAALEIESLGNGQKMFIGGNEIESNVELHLQWNSKQKTNFGGGAYFAGNVGIGKSPSSYALDVSGKAKFTEVFFGNSFLSPDQGGVVELVGSSSTATPYIDFRNKDTDWDARILLDGSQALQMLAKGGVKTSTFIATSKIQSPIVEGYGRNFHIGNELSSGFELTLREDGTSNTFTKIIGNYSLGWYDLANDASEDNGTEEGGPVGVLSAWNGLRFYTEKKQRLTISREGTVAVGGTLTAQKVEVKNMDLPDYVFADDYELRSLEEVESFINENSHLPEVPSAAEVAENGMDLTEMNNAMLKKIEELTLYLLEENKQNKAQQEQIELLTKQNEMLLQLLNK